MTTLLPRRAAGRWRRASTSSPPRRQPRRRHAARSSVRSSRTASPVGRRRRRRIAEHAVRRDAVDAARPAARASAVAERRGLTRPLARSRRTRSGRSASSSDVSVRPAWASPPATHGHHGERVAAVGVEGGHGPIDGVAVAAVAVDEHDAGGPVGGADELDDHGRHDVGADRQRAGEAGVLAAGRHGERRPDDDVAGPAADEALGQRLGDDRVGAAAAGADRAARTTRRGCTAPVGRRRRRATSCRSAAHGGR